MNKIQANESVFPLVLRRIGEDEYRVATEKDIREGSYLESFSGLSKRELFAKDIFCAIMSNSNKTKYSTSPNLGSQECSVAIALADELLKQLSE